LTGIQNLTQGVLKGDRRSIARAITVIENDSEGARKLVAAIYPHAGKAYVVGLTGPGGSGKSTLVEKIIREYRRRGLKVGVVAVDPSSPFSGGAFLGDRIRMQELSTDRDVFIRSMATRNYAGGIAKATKDAVVVLDAAGMDVVIVETAGAGQSEVEIVRVAQTTVVMHAPGLGDDIQAIKAGMMEIADIFVVNKADRESADKTVMDIQAMLQLSSKEDGWVPPILKTVALTGEGVQELVEKLDEHRRFLQERIQKDKGLLKSRAEAELIEALKEEIASSVVNGLKKEKRFDRLLENIVQRKVDPSSAAEKLVKRRFGDAEA
jgi:LAO/AO transport system kinase